MRRRAPHVARADTRNLTFNQQPRQGRPWQGKASIDKDSSFGSSVCCGPPTLIHTSTARCHLLCSTALAVAFILIEIKSKCFHSQNEIVRSALFLPWSFDIFVFDSIRFDSINVFQSIFWGFVCVGLLLMTSYCSNLGKVSVPILHSICWLFCGSLFHQLFIRKSYSHLPRGGICNCALALLTCLCVTHLCATHCLYYLYNSGSDNISK